MGKESNENMDEKSTKTWERIYLDMLDSYIEQVEKSAPTYLTTMEQSQNLYMEGVKKVLEAGQTLGDRSGLNLPLAKELAKIIESVTSLSLRAQLSIVKIYINSNIDIARSIRVNLEKHESQDEPKQ